MAEEKEKEIIERLLEFGFSQEKLEKNGLGFHVESGGRNLSAGEQQLIGIFRAIFCDKQIVIMDEATSNIDIK